MPNYYAHLCFGNEVLRSLPEPLARRLRQETESYCCGQYGPDPLYFYRPLSRNSTRFEGSALHHAPGAELLERYRGPVAADEPWSAGYAAGLVCHFALDSRCHPAIGEYMKAGGVTHAGIESALDAALMRQNGIDPFRETPMPSPPDQAELYLAAAEGFPRTPAELYRRALQAFCAYARRLTRANGTPLSLAVDGVSRIIPGARSIRGAVVGRRPNASLREITQALQELLEACVPFGAELVEEFFQCVDTGRELGPAFQTDFLGQGAPAAV